MLGCCVAGGREDARSPQRSTLFLERLARSIALAASWQPRGLLACRNDAATSRVKLPWCGADPYAYQYVIAAIPRKASAPGPVKMPTGVLVAPVREVRLLLAASDPRAAECGVELHVDVEALARGTWPRLESPMCHPACLRVGC
jgi:hypothetical protein